MTCARVFYVLETVSILREEGAKALQSKAFCGRITVTGERARCPICHVQLPGRFPADAVARKVMLQCRKCKREYEVNTISDQRPAATSVH